MNFDEFSSNYRETLNSSLGIFGTSNSFFDAYKINYIKNWLATDDRSYDILDFGCGIGKITALLAKEFSKSTIYGHDISKESLTVARKSNFDLKNVCFLDDLSRGQRFDLVLAIGVFHHIKPSERILTLRELKKLLKPAGRIVVFEHNPLNLLTRHIVDRCPFDKDAELIRSYEFVEIAQKSGLRIERKAYVLLFPWSSKIFRKIEGLFGRFPLGAQYMLLLKCE